MQATILSYVKEKNNNAAQYYKDRKRVAMNFTCYLLVITKEKFEKAEKWNLLGERKI